MRVGLGDGLAGGAGKSERPALGHDGVLQLARRATPACMIPASSRGCGTTQDLYFRHISHFHIEGHNSHRVQIEGSRAQRKGISLTSMRSIEQQRFERNTRNLNESDSDTVLRSPLDPARSSNEIDVIAESAAEGVSASAGERTSAATGAGASAPYAAPRRSSTCLSRTRLYPANPCPTGRIRSCTRKGAFSKRSEYAGSDDRPYYAQGLPFQARQLPYRAHDRALEPLVRADLLVDRTRT